MVTVLALEALGNFSLQLWNENVAIFSVNA